MTWRSSGILNLQKSYVWKTAPTMIIATHVMCCSAFRDIVLGAVTTSCRAVCETEYLWPKALCVRLKRAQMQAQIGYSDTEKFFHTCPPIRSPSFYPTYRQPTYLPTYLPTNIPTYLPTYLPTNIPTYLPTNIPTYLPTYLPSYLPTQQTN
jgi:hypothetical protein